MAFSSCIEWTESTWNPVTGCTKISLGCQHCYAERMAHRLKGMGSPRYRNGFRVTLHHDALSLPAAWQKPQMIFVNSMSDLFHQAVPLSFVREVFAVIAACPRHTFQVLTKRAERLAEIAHRLPWPDNVWIGVTVEAAQYLPRLDHLRAVPAAVRFVSFEPLLGPVEDVDLDGIHWVIVGGESGPASRPMDAAWARHIRDQCLEAGVPFFFKQWGGVRKREAGRMLDGRVWEQLPHPRPDRAATPPAGTLQLAPAR
jgi:protein gp37